LGNKNREILILKNMYRLAIIVGIISLALTRTSAQWVESSEGIYGGDIHCMAVDTVKNRIYVGTYNGVYLSTNEGETWTLLDEGMTNTWVHTLAICGDTLYAGTYNSSLYKSTNLGNSWTKIDFGIPDRYSFNDVFSIALDKNRISIGVSNAGIYLSEDYGRSWKDINFGLRDSIRLLRPVLQMSDNKIFAGFYDSGVYMLTIGDSAWTNRSNGITTTDIRSLCSIGDSLFAGTFKKGIFFSSDAGEHWNPANNGFGIHFPWDVNKLSVKGNSIYAATSDGLFSSSLNNINWNSMSANLVTHSSYAWSEVSSGDSYTEVSSFGFLEQKVFVGTLNGMHMSEYPWNSWTSVNQGINNVRVQTIAVSGETMFAGTNYDGIYQSTDNGMNWTAMNNGLHASLVYS